MKQGLEEILPELVNAVRQTAQLAIRRQCVSKHQNTCGRMLGRGIVRGLFCRCLGIYGSLSDSIKDIRMRLADGFIHPNSSSNNMVCPPARGGWSLPLFQIKYDGQKGSRKAIWGMSDAMVSHSSTQMHPITSRSSPRQSLHGGWSGPPPSPTSLCHIRSGGQEAVAGGGRWPAK